MYECLSKIVFIIALTIIYFCVKEEITNLDIASYIFISVSYLIFICIPYFDKIGLNKIQKDAPIYFITFVYLVLQIVTAVFAAFNYYEINIRSYILYQTLITGAYLIIFFILLCANERISVSVLRQNADILYLKTLKTELSEILLESDDTNFKREIENLIDVVRISPNASNEEVYDIENGILDCIETLKAASSQNKDIEEIRIICKKIENALYKRNNILKLNNYKR